jgi:hypothetical protein
MSLPQEIAGKAEEIVNSLTQTDYQHKDNIDPETGVYDCDCNGFVGFVLQNTAPHHLAGFPRKPVSRDRAPSSISASSPL